MDPGSSDHRVLSCFDVRHRELYGACDPALHRRTSFCSYRSSLCAQPADASLCTLSFQSLEHPSVAASRRGSRRPGQDRSADGPGSPGACSFPVSRTCGVTTLSALRAWSSEHPQAAPGAGGQLGPPPSSFSSGSSNAATLTCFTVFCFDKLMRRKTSLGRPQGTSHAEQTWFPVTLLLSFQTHLVPFCRWGCSNLSGAVARFPLGCC